MNRRERKAALREKEKREGQSRKTRRDQQRLGRLLVILTVAAAIINVLILIFAIRSHFVGLEGDRGMAAALAMAYYGVWLILPSNRWGYEGNWSPFWGYRKKPEWMVMGGEEGKFNVRVYNFLTKMMAIFIIVNGVLLLTAWYRFEGPSSIKNDPARSA